MTSLANVLLPRSRRQPHPKPFDLGLSTASAITTVVSVEELKSPTSQTTASPDLLLPPLCHPHVHLDKPYILTCNHPPSAQHPDYTDLAPQSSSFDEALTNTSKAKQRYTPEDLYLRGSQLLAASYSHGVTSLRAFVEIDHVTGIAPLQAAVKLKSDFSHLLHLQICVFAQDPIFSTDHGTANRKLIASTLVDYANSIDALGTTPYVETSRDASLKNIDWAVKTALEHNVHLDFHLDYNLQAITESTPEGETPLVFAVLDALKRCNWNDAADPAKTIALGHCTQLTMLSDSMMQDLAQRVRESGLPIHFVGLPTSDIFMMGRPGAGGGTHARPRGTLQVPSMIKDLGLNACLGINNVGNAFTPFGTADPLQLASWGVGIYQAGTEEDAEILYGCISWRARRAIGLDVRPDVEFKLEEGKNWEKMMLVKNSKFHELPGCEGQDKIRVPGRPRLGFKDVVWDPPESHLRSIV